MYEEEASEGDKLKYALEFERLTPSQKLRMKKDRYNELLESGVSGGRAAHQIDAEEKMIYEYVKEANVRKKRGIPMTDQEGTELVPYQQPIKKIKQEETGLVPQQRREVKPFAIEADWKEVKEEPESTPKDSFTDWTDWKQVKKDPESTPKDSFTDKIFGKKSRTKKEEEEPESTERGQTIDDFADKIFGGVGSFIKGKPEAIKKGVISGTEKILSGGASGAKKVATAIKGKPRTLAERIEEEEARKSGKSGKKTTAGDFSFKNLGKGGMGAKRYEGAPSTPDFFGGGSGFGGGAPSTRVHSGGSRPPSTKVPYGGSKAPSTRVPSGGSRPPSTKVPSSGGRPPSTKFSGAGKVSTHVPTIKTKAPSTRFSGAERVSTKIPKGSRRPPVRQEKVGKPISTRIGRTAAIKTKIVTPRENAEDVLGLKGFM